MDVAFGDADLVDRLALPQRNLAERTGERAVEREGDVLVDDEPAVARQLDDDLRVGESEALRACLWRNEERDGRERGRQNCTRGASRTGSSISKNGFSSNPNIPATRFVGIVSRAFSYVSTVSL